MICKICNKEIGKCGMGSHLKRTHKINPEDYYNKYLGQPKFCICGKKTSFLNVYSGYRDYCSQNCARRAILEQTREKYNVTNISQVEEIKSKMKASLKDNWSSLSEQEYKNRCQAISNGTTKAMKDVVFNYKNDINQYCHDNDLVKIVDLEQLYGTGFIQSEAFKYTLDIVYYKNCRLVSIDAVDKIIAYNNLKVRSRTEYILFNIVKDICEDAILNYRGLQHRELDIYIPSKKIAIEYNGSYWHSIESGMSIDFHLNKSIECRQNGIRLIHIYEFEDFNKQVDLLVDLLKNNIDNFDLNFNKNNLKCSVPEPYAIYHRGFTVYSAGPL